MDRCGLRLERGSGSDEHSGGPPHVGFPIESTRSCAEMRPAELPSAPCSELCAGAADAVVRRPQGEHCLTRPTARSGERACAIPPSAAVPGAAPIRAHVALGPSIAQELVRRHAQVAGRPPGAALVVSLRVAVQWTVSSATPPAAALERAPRQAAREVAAHLLDHKGFADAPPPSLSPVCRPASHRCVRVVFVRGGHSVAFPRPPPPPPANFRRGSPLASPPVAARPLRPPAIRASNGDA